MKVTKNTIVAEICLYGNGKPDCGVGYLATINPEVKAGVGMIGDGEEFAVRIPAAEIERVAAEQTAARLG